MEEVGDVIDTEYHDNPDDTWAVTLQGPNVPSGTSKTYRIKVVGLGAGDTPTGDSASITVNLTVSGGP